MYDIVIIGGGCIGNYLALILSELGFKVIVIEKKSAAGVNICCTGIISSACHELLADKIELKSSRLNSAIITAPHSHKINFQSNGNIAYIIERFEFEKSLADRAHSNGASLLYSTKVTGIITNKDSVLVNALNMNRSEQFRAKMAIISTGYGPKLPLSCGFGKIDKYVIGAQAEVDVTDSSILELYLDKRVSPAGFAWLVRTWDNKGFAGLLCKSHPKTYMKSFLQLLKSHNKIADENYDVYQGLIPVKPLNKTFAERMLVVGEAAGQVKPLTGGGIYYGVICADIAIETIKEAFKLNDFSGKQLSSYQKKWHQLLKNELNTAYNLRYIWEKLNNQTIDVMFNTAEKLNLFEEINNSNNICFDWHVKTISNLLTSLMPFAKSK
jgi:digeranylgeranylglycerophospholipid reductase